jgi:hypothetical protein
MLTYPERNRQTKVNVLIDSGNSLDHCARCAQDLGLNLLPCDLEVNTADWHHKMTPCGQINNLGIIFPGTTETTPLQSVLVLPDLNGDVNLAISFYKGTKVSFHLKEVWADPHYTCLFFRVRLKVPFCSSWVDPLTGNLKKDPFWE